jgi:HEPN domain-containing protein
MKKSIKYATDVAAWLSKANEDLSWANYDFKGKYFSQTCFASQQTVEKALKAYLLYNNTLPPKIHNLLELLVLCQKFDKNLERFKKYCETLDQYYIGSRYPDTGSGEYSEDEAQEALELASKILDFVKKKIEL